MTRTTVRPFVTVGQLLLGAPRVGRARQPRQQPREGFPGGEIYLSFPGLGDRLTARVAGEIGDGISQFTSPNALQCYAGRAPVTRRARAVSQMPTVAAAAITPRKASFRMTSEA